LSAGETNRILAAEILAALHAAGVRTLCLCPGGRNAPLILAADAARGAFDLVSFFEERSAGFFALGRCRRDNAPVAVVTTSGTAAAELLPPVLEAAHSGLPLIVVTADRPRRLRGTGAPQTIDQVPLFAAARAPVLDLEAPGQLGGDLPAVAGPLHLNVCFDEPLGGEPLAVDFDPAPPGPAGATPWMTETEVRAACDDFFSRVRRPLVLVSSLRPDDARALAPWLASLDSPLYLEAVSQLRGHAALQKTSLRGGERILLTPECRRACDGVLRLGGVPTPRYWRELEDFGHPVLHVSRVDLPGLARPDPVVPLDRFLPVCRNYAPPGGGHEALFALDRAAERFVIESLAVEPRSEAALVLALDELLPDAARVFLGNSLPIREWDLVARRRTDERTFFANRGVNGIDGLVSSALGLADPVRPTAAIIGDLSALYDLPGLWPAEQMPEASLTIAVLNNGGGAIFDRMFKHQAFRNAHGLNFRGWADMFGWHYAALAAAGDPWPPGRRRLVEVRPDAAATRRWSESLAAWWHAAGHS